MSAPEFVYYAEACGSRGADGRIKIGYSRNPALRTARLRSRILAVEHGSRSLERQRHAQFADLALGNEWFRPGHRLLAHIAFLRSHPVEIPEIDAVPRVNGRSLAPRATSALKFDERVVALTADGRRHGQSWVAVSRRISKEHGVSISPQTLWVWFPQYRSPERATRAKAS